jgi:hypothetical protein
MNSTTFNYSYKENKNFTFGLFNDLHIDECDFNKELFHKHMKEVCDEKGRIFTNGDNSKENFKIGKNTIIN